MRRLKDFVTVFFLPIFSVLMAVVTTYMTCPVLRRLIRQTELEPLFQVSGFMQQGQRAGERDWSAKSR